MTTADPNVTEALASVPRIGAEEARVLVVNAGALLVDVREEEELARTGRLAGALHIPRALAEVGDLRLEGERPLLLYCAAGIRSALAGKALIDRGRRRVYNLGGFAEIAAAGWPVEPG